MGAKIIVCGAVGVLGIIALILGFAAKTHAVKANDFTFSSDNTTCSYKSSPAAGEGVIGALCILTAEIVANVAGGCVCCCPARPKGLLKTGAKLCLVLSWFFTIMSFLLLLIMGFYNSSMPRRTIPINGLPGLVYCPIPLSWPFPVGGVVALVATVLAILFYLLATSAGKPRPYGRQVEGIGMHGMPYK